MKRDWSAARSKVEQEGRCRNCGRSGALEAAHTIGRKHDPPSGVVQPLDIIPLCRDCHRSYDGRSLSILPVLTWEEQAQAVRHVGIMSALRRLTSDREAGNENPTPVLGRFMPQ